MGLPVFITKGEYTNLKARLNNPKGSSLLRVPSAAAARVACAPTRSHSYVLRAVRQITTPEDLFIAERLLDEQKEAAAKAKK